ncbi:MAG TPA: ATP-binding cassette domain-containing protein [Candidatus Saccharimonadales bacterium]|nr:ATP-binding cassette domain-containing protein [Candidatus Saccharimonadales bacterium]
MAQLAFEVKNAAKYFGDVKAVDGISLKAEQGKVLGLLGPNGAGKTTLVKMLSTLLLPTKGTVKVMGFDAAEEPEKVRGVIGLTGQYAAVDEYLTGLENLQMMGRLYRLSTKESKKRAHELIEQFGLANAAKRPVKTYSGGMKRRIDLAMSLIATPPVIFLDEPTTGLDPRSRIAMWDTVKELVKGGTTILLTTQYMDEADQLADNIVVIDNGKVIAEGTPDSLKSKVGSERLEITIGKSASLEESRKVIGGKGVQVDDERQTISVTSKGGVGKLKQVLGQLEEAKIEVEAISLHRPTLDDVFMSLTGHSATSEEVEAKKGQQKGRRHG